MAKIRKKIADVTTDDSTSRRPIDAQDAGDMTVGDADRERIAFRAYELYMARGGQDGRALDDWLEAEQELLVLTRGSRDRE